LEFLSVNNSSFGQFRYLSSFLGLESFGIKITSIDHKFEIILVRFDQTVIYIGFRMRESTATQQLLVLFIISSEW